MIDNVLGTFVLIKDIQADQNDKHYSENMSKLEILVDQISLSAIIPPQFYDELSTEGVAFFYYISSLREAVAGAKYGYGDHVKQILNNGITREFSPSIQSLEYYWNCMSEEPVHQTETDTLVEEPLYLGASTTTVKKASSELSKPLVEKLISIRRPDSKGLSKRVKLALPESLSDASVLLSLTALLVLFGIVYYVQMHANNNKERETRRLLHMPSKIRIGKEEHAIIIVDISMNGTKIKHSELIRQQGKLHIKLDGIWYSGKIKWNNKLFAGVKFVRPISLQTFDAVLRAA